MQLNHRFAPSFAEGNAPAPSNLSEVLLPADTPLPPVGFAATTPIQTPDGAKSVSALAVGDHVVTFGGGRARVEAIDRLYLTAQDLQLNPNSAPIRFDPTALPGMLGDAALLLSGDLPVYNPQQANLNLLGNDTFFEAQFPASAYCDGGLIRRVIPEEGVHYINLHLEGTHQICAAGIWVEANTSCPMTPNVSAPLHRHANDTCMFRPLS